MDVVRIVELTSMDARGFLRKGLVGGGKENTRINQILALWPLGISHKGIPGRHGKGRRKKTNA